MLQYGALPARQHLSRFPDGLYYFLVGNVSHLGSSGFQARSTSKPFVLAAAADDGIGPDTTFRAPPQLTAS